MCNQRYEDREKRIWGEMCCDDDDNNHKVISYFVKKSHGQPYDIDGTVFTPKEWEHDIVLDAKKAFDMVSDRLYTKSGRKKLRKAMYEELEKNSYEWEGLLHYLRQAYQEGATKVLLSRKEIAMISKPLTKKQERDKRLSKNLMTY